MTKRGVGVGGTVPSPGGFKGPGRVASCGSFRWVSQGLPWGPWVCADEVLPDST